MRFCRRLAALAGLTPEEVYARVFASDLDPAYDTGRLTSEEFHRRVTEASAWPCPSPGSPPGGATSSPPWRAWRRLSSGWPGAIPYYLVSNTNPLHFAHIREHYALLHHFKRLVLSFEVGSRKPEPAIYRALIRQTGLPPQQCLFVDDKLPLVRPPGRRVCSPGSSPPLPGLSGFCSSGEFYLVTETYPDSAQIKFFKIFYI